MIDPALLETAIRSPTLLSTAILLLLAWFLKVFNNRSKMPLPVAELKDGKITESFMKARENYPDTPFVFPLSPPWIILPHSVVEEVKALPEDKLSLQQHLYDWMLGRYTGIGVPSPETIEAIKVDLTRNITKVLSDLQEEIVYACNREIGECPEWTKVPVYGKVLQLVALLSGRTFVGLPLSRDKEWTDATINFNGDTFRAIQAIVKYHPLIWPLISHLLPEVKRLRAYREFAGKKLKPKVDAILSRRSEKGNGHVPEDVLGDDVKGDFNMIHWTVNHIKDINSADAIWLGQLQMLIAFAAIHTTSMALSHAIFDLAAHPQYITELREEIENVIADENYPDKMLRKTSMPKLRKLDSFIKESQRVSPPGMVAMTRKVTARSGLTLSTGHTIPYGSTIGFGHPFQPFSPAPSTGLLKDSSQTPLSEFYPWRYSNLRSIPREENKHQFVSVGPESITFGNGTHACPGRFFASNEIKVVLVELLKRYDIGLGPNGEGEGVQGFKRPELLEYGTNYALDPTATVWVRNRKVT